MHSNPISPAPRKTTRGAPPVRQNRLTTTHHVGGTSKIRRSSVSGSPHGLGQQHGSQHPGQQNGSHHHGHHGRSSQHGSGHDPFFGSNDHEPFGSNDGLGGEIGESSAEPTFQQKFGELSSIFDRLEAELRQISEYHEWNPKKVMIVEMVSIRIKRLMATIQEAQQVDGQQGGSPLEQDSADSKVKVKLLAASTIMAKANHSKEDHDYSTTVSDQNNEHLHQTLLERNREIRHLKNQIKKIKKKLANSTQKKDDTTDTFRSEYEGASPNKYGRSAHVDAQIKDTPGGTTSLGNTTASRNTRMDDKQGTIQQNEMELAMTEFADGIWNQANERGTSQTKQNEGLLRRIGGNVSKTTSTKLRKKGGTPSHPQAVKNRRPGFGHQGSNSSMSSGVGTVPSSPDRSPSPGRSPETGGGAVKHAAGMGGQQGVPVGKVQTLNDGMSISRSSHGLDGQMGMIRRASLGAQVAGRNIGGVVWSTHLEKTTSAPGNFHGNPGLNPGSPTSLTTAKPYATSSRLFRDDPLRMQSSRKKVHTNRGTLNSKVEHSKDPDGEDLGFGETELINLVGMLNSCCDLESAIELILSELAGFIDPLFLAGTELWLWDRERNKVWTTVKEGGGSRRQIDMSNLVDKDELESSVENSGASSRDSDPDNPHLAAVSFPTTYANQKGVVNNNDDALAQMRQVLGDYNVYASREKDDSVEIQKGITHVRRIREALEYNSIIYECNEDIYIRTRAGHIKSARTCLYIPVTSKGLGGHAAKTSGSTESRITSGASFGSWRRGSASLEGGAPLAVLLFYMREIPKHTYKELREKLLASKSEWNQRLIGTTNNAASKTSSGDAGDPKKAAQNNSLTSKSNIIPQVFLSSFTLFTVLKEAGHCLQRCIIFDKLYEQKRQNEFMRHLVVPVFNLVNSLKEIIREMSSVLKSLLNCEYVQIFLRDYTRDKIYTYIGVSEKAFRISDIENPASHVALTGEVLSIRDYQKKNRIGFIDDVHIKNCLIVPIFAHISEANRVVQQYLRMVSAYNAGSDMYSKNPGIPTTSSGLLGGTQQHGGYRTTSSRGGGGSLNQPFLDYIQELAAANDEEYATGRKSRRGSKEDIASIGSVASLASNVTEPDQASAANQRRSLFLQSGKFPKGEMVIDGRKTSTAFGPSYDKKTTEAPVYGVVIAMNKKERRALVEEDVRNINTIGSENRNTGRMMSNNSTGPTYPNNPSSPKGASSSPKAKSNHNINGNPHLGNPHLGVVSQGNDMNSVSKNHKASSTTGHGIGNDDGLEDPFPTSSSKISEFGFSRRDEDLLVKDLNGIMFMSLKCAVENSQSKTSLESVTEQRDDLLNRLFQYNIIRNSWQKLLESLSFAISSTDAFTCLHRFISGSTAKLLNLVEIKFVNYSPESKKLFLDKETEISVAHLCEKQLQKDRRVDETAKLKEEFLELTQITNNTTKTKKGLKGLNAALGTTAVGEKRFRITTEYTPKTKGKQSGKQSGKESVLVTTGAAQKFMQTSSSGGGPNHTSSNSYGSILEKVFAKREALVIKGNPFKSSQNLNAVYDVPQLGSNGISSYDEIVQILYIPFLQDDRIYGIFRFTSIDATHKGDETLLPFVQSLVELLAQICNRTAIAAGSSAGLGSSAIIGGGGGGTTKTGSGGTSGGSKSGQSVAASPETIANDIREIYSASGLRDLIGSVTRATRRSLRCARAYVLSTDPIKDQESLWTLDPNKESVKLEIDISANTSKYLEAYVYHSNAIQNLNQAQTLTSTKLCLDSALGYQPTTLLCVPIRSQGDGKRNEHDESIDQQSTVPLPHTVGATTNKNVIGVIVAVNKSGDLSFSQADELVLMSYADAAGVGLKHSLEVLKKSQENREYQYFLSSSVSLLQASNDFSSFLSVAEMIGQRISNMPYVDLFLLNNEQNSFIGIKRKFTWLSGPGTIGGIAGGIAGGVGAGGTGNATTFTDGVLGGGMGVGNWSQSTPNMFGTIGGPETTKAGFVNTAGGNLGVGAFHHLGGGHMGISLGGYCAPSNQPGGVLIPKNTATGFGMAGSNAYNNPTVTTAGVLARNYTLDAPQDIRFQISGQGAKPEVNQPQVTSGASFCSVGGELVSMGNDARFEDIAAFGRDGKGPPEGKTGKPSSVTLVQKLPTLEISTKDDHRQHVLRERALEILHVGSCGYADDILSGRILWPKDLYLNKENQIVSSSEKKQENAPVKKIILVVPVVLSSGRVVGLLRISDHVNNVVVNPTTGGGKAATTSGGTAASGGAGSSTLAINIAGGVAGQGGVLGGGAGIGGVLGGGNPKQKSIDIGKLKAYSTIVGQVSNWIKRTKPVSSSSSKNLTPRLLLVTNNEGKLYRFHGSAKAILGKSDSSLRTQPCWRWFSDNEVWTAATKQVFFNSENSSLSGVFIKDHHWILNGIIYSCDLFIIPLLTADKTFIHSMDGSHVHNPSTNTSINPNYTDDTIKLDTTSTTNGTKHHQGVVVQTREDIEISKMNKRIQYCFISFSNIRSFHQSTILPIFVSQNSTDDTGGWRHLLKNYNQNIHHQFGAAGPGLIGMRNIYNNLDNTTLNVMMLESNPNSIDNHINANIQMGAAITTQSFGSLNSAAQQGTGGSSGSSGGMVPGGMTNITTGLTNLGDRKRDQELMALMTTSLVKAKYLCDIFLCCCRLVPLSEASSSSYQVLSALMKVTESVGKYNGCIYSVEKNDVMILFFDHIEMLAGGYGIYQDLQGLLDEFGFDLVVIGQHVKAFSRIPDPQNFTLKSGIGIGGSGGMGIGGTGGGDQGSSTNADPEGKTLKMRSEAHQGDSSKTSGGAMTKEATISPNKAAAADVQHIDESDLGLIEIPQVSMHEMVKCVTRVANYHFRGFFVTSLSEFDHDFVLIAVERIHVLDLFPKSPQTYSLELAYGLGERDEKTQTYIPGMVHDIPEATLTPQSGALLAGQGGKNSAVGGAGGQGGSANARNSSIFLGSRGPGGTTNSPGSSDARKTHVPNDILGDKPSSTMFANRLSTIYSVHGRACEVSPDVIESAARIQVAFKALESGAILTAIHEYVNLLQNDLEVHGGILTVGVAPQLVMLLKRALKLILEESPSGFQIWEHPEPTLAQLSDSLNQFSIRIADEPWLTQFLEGAVELLGSLD